VLKGALLLRVWDVSIARPTRDIDLLARPGNDLDAIRRLVGDICKAPVEPDGMEFDPGTVVTERISEDADYEGVRATFQGLLGTVRCAMQIDMGFSDVVTPGPVDVDYPTILDLPAPHLRAYNRETAIAEKLEAMLKLGELNSRMKDSFDVWILSTTASFGGRALVEAVLPPSGAAARPWTQRPCASRTTTPARSQRTHSGGLSSGVRNCGMCRSPSRLSGSQR
jgi:hypothetical protein